MFRKNILNDILELSLPVLGEMLIYTLMWIIDLIMIGKFGGNEAVSTVGLCDEIMYTCINIFIATGLSVGIASLISRRVGGGHIPAAEEYASIGIVTGFLISLSIYVVLTSFTKQILIFSGAKGNVLSSGIIYMKITSFGILFNMLTNITSSILRGYGNTKTPCLTAGIVTILKLFLDWVFIFGALGIPSQGIRGPALATVISELTGFFYIFTYFILFSKVKPRLKYITSINLSRVKQLLFLSIPSSAEESAFSISRLLCNIIIIKAGTVAFAANQIANTIESISIMPGLGFGMASTTLVGICCGKKDFKTARRYAYASTLLATFMMLTCSVVFLLIPEPLVSLFINQNENHIIHVAAACLAIGAFEQPPLAISMVLAGCLKGLGDTKSPFYVSLFTSWAIRLPLLYYIIHILNKSVIYVWWITVIQWLINSLLMIVVFRNKFKFAQTVKKAL